MAIDVVTLALAKKYASSGRVELDASLTVEGKAADAKATGDALVNMEEHVNTSVSEKISLPKENDTPNYGTAGQFAVSDGAGGITWKTLYEAEEVSY